MNLNHPFSTFLLNFKKNSQISSLFSSSSIPLGSRAQPCVFEDCYYCVVVYWSTAPQSHSVRILEVMVLLASLSLCNSVSPIQFSLPSKPSHPISFPVSGFLNLRFFDLKDGRKRKNSPSKACRLRVLALTDKNSSESREMEDGEGDDPSVPSWAKPGSDELPPWALNEAQKESSSFEVPFFVYLLASAITAIAAIGSVFEYVNQRPVFGVLNSDSVFYTPVLGFFAFTGIPTSAFLWFKSVQVANKEAEEQDRRDGYL